ncbi:MAG TPA: 4'-phosphopantetheinyl transferase superfamily protein [Gemmatimonadota bacterium]|nr:4'-phosphopantetheinyl transferase superfamily protein [Gemmatimonadota bacterium]
MPSSLARLVAPLERGTVHVWDVDLVRSHEEISSLERLLPEGEVRRAARQPLEARRRDLVVSGAALRSILASYLEADPRAVRFSIDAGGKPRIDAAWNEAPLAFNLSHSRGRALVAVTLEREVGIDLERLRRDLSIDRLASRFFSPREIAALRSMPDELRSAAFFACWTRKEAFVKATGAGIFRQSLQSFAVSVDPGPGPVPLVIPGHDAEAGRWRLESIVAPPGYAAAVAVEGPFRVRRFHWNG